MGLEDDEFWILKIHALLHDPPDKVLDVVNHVKRAEAIKSALNLPKLSCDDKKKISKADVAASASDRIPLYRGQAGLPEISWNKHEEVILHPMSSEGLVREDLKVTNVSDPRKGIKVEKVNSKAVVSEMKFSKLTDKAVETLKNVKERELGWRRLYLWIWRMLDQLHGEKGFRGFIASWFPADSRIPDHSIYDHLVTTSSFLVDEPTLLAFDIGGVQKFISHSRKARDLWASSYLVSLMALSGMIEVVKELGPDSIIHPDLRGNPFIDLYLYLEGVLRKDELLNLWGGVERFVKALLTPSIPGSFTSIVPGGEVDKIKGKVDQKVRGLFKRLWDQLEEWILKALPNATFYFSEVDGIPFPLSLRSSHVRLEEVDSLDSKLRDCKDLDCILEGLKDSLPEELVELDGVMGLLESFARIILVRNKLGGYKVKGSFFYPLAYRLLQLKMMALKYMQEFELLEEPAEISLNPGEVIVRRRCKLCGSRNPIALSNGGRISEREGWRNFLERLRERASGIANLLSEEEPLCPVCLIKRLLRSTGGPELLLGAWAYVMDVDLETLKGKLRELGALDKLREEVRNIPTLDDVAAKLAKELLKEGGEEANKLINQLFLALNAVAEFYKEIRDKDRALASKVRGVLAELGFRYPSLVDESGLFKAYSDYRFEDPERIPGTLLFPSTWKNVIRMMDRAGLPKEKIEGWKGEIERLIEIMEKYSEFKSRLSNYLALIYFDGDRIGDWVSGIQLIRTGSQFYERVHPALRNDSNLGPVLDDLKGAYKLATPSYHRTLSRVLRDMALSVFPHIVESLGGFVFYSGGDDLLAMVPASGGMPIKLITALHTAFSSEVIKIGQTYVMGMGNKATASSGLLISHRLVPMSEMLRLARGEEEVAKGEALKGEGCRAKGNAEAGGCGGRDRSSILRVARGQGGRRALIPGDLLRSNYVEELSRKVFSLMRGEGEVRLSKSFLRDMLEYLELYSAMFDSVGGDKELLSSLIRRCVSRNLHGAAGKADVDKAKELIDLYMKIAEIRPEDPVKESPLYNAHMALLLVYREVLG